MPMKIVINVGFLYSQLERTFFPQYSAEGIMTRY